MAKNDTKDTAVKSESPAGGGPYRDSVELTPRELDLIRRLRLVDDGENPVHFARMETGNALLDCLIALGDATGQLVNEHSPVASAIARLRKELNL